MPSPDSLVGSPRPGTIVCMLRTHRHSPLRVAAMVLVLAMAVEMRALVTGASTTLNAAALVLTFLGLVLVITHDAMAQTRQRAGRPKAP
jgi:hypothetical protein